MVPIQLGTDRDTVNGPSEALFVKWLRWYIADVVPATDYKFLSFLSAG